MAPSLDILKKLESQLTFPLWLNADILQGPGGNPHPVDADLFLDLCFQHFPSATLSIGYTTASEVRQVYLISSNNIHSCKFNIYNKKI